jgi:thioredoxin reductase
VFVHLFKGNRSARQVSEARQPSVGRTLGARALFVCIGAEANTGWLEGAVELDERGFIPTGRALDGSALEGDVWQELGRKPYLLGTSLPGVFAAGDVRRGSIKRVTSAVGEGSMAVRLVHQYLADTGVSGRRMGSSPHEATMVGTSRRGPLRKNPKDTGAVTMAFVMRK